MKSEYLLVAFDKLTLMRVTSFIYSPVKLSSNPGNVPRKGGRLGRIAMGFLDSFNFQLWGREGRQFSCTVSCRDKLVHSAGLSMGSEHWWGTNCYDCRIVFFLFCAQNLRRWGKRARWGHSEQSTLYVFFWGEVLTTCAAWQRADFLKWSCLGESKPPTCCYWGTAWCGLLWRCDKEPHPCSERPVFNWWTCCRSWEKK